MFVVGLVQNQSEMAHYGYADARSLIEKLRTGKEEYTHILYTADNIDTLLSDISENRVDAVIFASNAFNDKRIENVVFSNSFKKVIEDNISRLGIMVFHQLKLSKGETSVVNLSFLPSPYCEITAAPRPKNERSIDGKLTSTLGSKDHICLLYPDSINIDELQQQAQKFKNLPGLYWHYWKGEKFADWDVLIEDNTNVSKTRPIVLCSKESLGHRIVISSMPLDWQKHQDLFTNLMIYVVEGRHDTAIIRSESDTDLSFNFLIDTMYSKKFPFTLYNTGQDLRRLRSHIQTGVHSVLLIGPDITLSNLDPELNETIHNSLSKNHLKILDVESKEGKLRKFSTLGRSKFAYHLLQRAELAIHSELRAGQIDGSFWSTVETLQSLEQLESRSTDYKNMVDEFLKNANQREKNGSYDETFSATCAFYWLRAKYTGISSRQTKRTESWLKSNIDRYDDREKALGYVTLAEMNQLSPKNREKLITVLSDLNEDKVSEFDLLIYLRASLHVKSEAHIAKIVWALTQKQDNGLWIDLTTTATVASVLIDILNSFKDQAPNSTELLTKIEALIFNAVIKILEAFEHSAKISQNDPYPWDGKASTTVKCLQAWLKFDDLLDLPVYEVVNSLEMSNNLSQQISSSKTALTVLDEIRNDNKKLQIYKEKYNSVSEKLKALTNFRRRILFLALPVVYILATILWGVYLVKGVDTLKSLFFEAFYGNLTTHVAVITTFATVAGAYFAYLSIRDKSWFPNALKFGSSDENQS